MCKTCTTFSARPSLQNDMDGGVAAALIEEEAEQRACPDLDAHWRLDEAMDRAEKAEQERDEARANAYNWEATAEEWKKRALAAESRPLMPEVTDEMVERYWAAMKNPGSNYDEAVRSALAAALTEPTRPDGAEEIEAVLRDEWTFSDEDGGEDAFADLAERLASRGVRVVTEEEGRHATDE